MDPIAKNSKPLSNSHQILSTLINTIPNPAFFRNKDGVFIDCNTAFAEKILGTRCENIVGQSVFELPEIIPQALMDFCLENDKKLLDNPGIQTDEAAITCADGVQRDFLLSRSTFTDHNGVIDGIVSVMLDLTEKNRAARDRFQKEKLQGVLETAGAVCHEMNQPLQTILGHTELSLADISPDNPAYLSLTKISKQIDRMAEITRKLQSITHYETMDYDRKTKIIDIHKASSM